MDLEKELKFMLLPVDQDDEKSVFLEIRAEQEGTKQPFLLVIFYECIHDSQRERTGTGDNFRKTAEQGGF